MLMSLTGVTKRFGSLQVLNDVNFEVQAGEIFGIAGPNGAGKSTLLNACTGLVYPDSGQIVFSGQRTERLPPHRLCHLGIARTYQIPQVFESLSVRENIETGALFGDSTLKSTKQNRVDAILELLGLTALRDANASEGDLLTRKMVMLGAALATHPTLVFMDEPFGGLNSDEIDGYAELVLKLRKELGISFVIVEHKMRALTRLSNRLLILNFGSVLCLDTPQNVMADPQVIDTYLGATGHAQG
ncbi:ATP-binding cassette domain-containing protein [Pseudomonas sediminis]|uniref:ABC transporter ATP-binding protein n=1 Tax=Pseudomonas sediminis TaxID=1691904 RepID=UPI00244B12D6|nr:ATP-binding cassette domain-containing protein [Pseudomonas sediminis]MDG9759559.1 ATP-binding cassette domain-containing protein [Pseudomonas sediminis]